MTPQPGARRAAWLLALPALVALILYWPALGYGLVWDDHTFFNGQQGIFRNWEALWQALFSPLLESRNYFRPVAMLFLGAEHLLSGGNPAAGHAMALALHAANATLVALLAMLLTRPAPDVAGSAAAGAVAGLLYALHPALIETAAWISGRFDQLVTFFCLLCLLADRLIAAAAARALMMALLFLCAALSKEMAVGFMLALPAWHLFFEQRAPATGLWASFRSKGHLWVYAGLFAAGLAYLLLRQQALGYLHQEANHVPFSTAFEHLLVVLKTLGRFWVLALAPFVTVGPLHLIGGQLGFADREVLLALFMLTLILAGSVWALRGGPRAPLLALCGLLSSWPVLNLIRVENRDNLINDRFLALPLVFLVLAVALLGWHLLRPGNRRVLLAAALGLWLLLSTLTILRVLPHWKDNLRFWLWTYQLTPQDVIAGSNLQAGLMDAGYTEAARKVSEEMLAHGGGKLDALQRVRYAKALCLTGNCRQEAVAQAETALREIPEGYSALQRGALYSIAGWVNYEAGQLQAAAPHLREAVRAVPDAADTWYLLGVVETAAGQEQAAGSLTKAYALMNEEQSRQRQAEFPALVESARKRAAAPKEQK